MQTIDDEVISVPDYEKMYKTLFNAITDAVEILQNAQQDTEEQYISAEPTVIRVLPFDKDSAAEGE